MAYGALGIPDDGRPRTLLARGGSSLVGMAAAVALSSCTVNFLTCANRRVNSEHCPFGQ